MRTAAESHHRSGEPTIYHQPLERPNRPGANIDRCERKANGSAIRHRSEAASDTGSFRAGSAATADSILDHYRTQTRSSNASAGSSQRPASAISSPVCPGGATTADGASGHYCSGTRSATEQRRSNRTACRCY